MNEISLIPDPKNLKDEIFQLEMDKLDQISWDEQDKIDRLTLKEENMKQNPKTHLRFRKVFSNIPREERRAFEKRVLERIGKV